MDAPRDGTLNTAGAPLPIALDSKASLALEALARSFGVDETGVVPADTARGAVATGTTHPWGQFIAFSTGVSVAAVRLGRGHNQRRDHDGYCLDFDRSFFSDCWYLSLIKYKINPK